MYRLLRLGCDTLREGVVVSAGLFAGALLALGVAVWLAPPTGLAKALLLLTAAVLLVLAAVVLLSTFLLAVLPGARQRLGKCDH